MALHDAIEPGIYIDRWGSRTTGYGKWEGLRAVGEQYVRYVTTSCDTNSQIIAVRHVKFILVNVGTLLPQPAG